MTSPGQAGYVFFHIGLDITVQLPGDVMPEWWDETLNVGCSKMSRHIVESTRSLTRSWETLQRRVCFKFGMGMCLRCNEVVEMDSCWSSSPWLWEAARALSSDCLRTWMLHESASTAWIDCPLIWWISSKGVLEHNINVTQQTFGECSLTDSCTSKVSGCHSMNAIWNYQTQTTMRPLNWHECNIYLCSWFWVIPQWL